MGIRRRRFLIGMGALSCIGLHGIRRAGAQVLPRAQVSDLGNQGALYRIVIDVGGGESILCTAAALPRQSFAARIVEQRTMAGALGAVPRIARASNATVAINGGPFNGAFAPDGLLVVDKNVVGRKRADWVGYLTIDTDGMATVTNKPDLRRAQYALQGDPLLIEPGGKMGMMRDDGRRFRRSLIVQSGDIIIAMVTSPVSLFDLAAALIELPGSFYASHFDAALNLSGAATTGFYAKLTDGQEVIVPAYWPNRDVVTFTSRAAAV